VTQFYRMHDAAPNGVFPIARSEAATWNAQGNGVFATINEFDGARRIENLRRICTWAVDLDEGDKEQQLRRIESTPLIPSRIVETKNGYHVHWHAEDGTAKRWNEIVLDRLVPWFGADKNARDIARILRVPGYWHLKDPEAPFMVRLVMRADVTYTERMMLESFPDVGGDARRGEEAEKDRERARRMAGAEARRNSRGESFWEAAIALDCGDALERLSGSWLIGGEQITFRKCRNGNRNIVCDGKQTSCFVDSQGRIGSSDNGGPSIVRWARWFGHSYADIARGLKEYFPHLAELDSRRSR
jgi:hypothetical protein